MHANEIVLLAYYVAAINIEETYHALQGGNYVPFDGIVLTDTFQMFEDDDELDDMGIFQANNDRVIAQKERDIRVIIGNPPYSTGQKSSNDGNSNNDYPTLDAHIRESYAAKSSATNKNNLYDSYIRAIRWASDRVGNEGVVAFVSNGGFIEGNTADGLRRSLIDEFTSIYVFNLRGNQRTAGDQSRREGGKVFGAGSRATIAVSVLVKNPSRETPGNLFYYDIGDYLTREQKLDRIAKFQSVDAIPWVSVEPSPEGDWLGQRSVDFAAYSPLGDRDPTKRHVARIFALYSPGLQTNRDAWVYGFSQGGTNEAVARLVRNFNHEIERWQSAGLAPEDVATFVNTDEKFVKWTGPLISDVARGKRAAFTPECVQQAMYRPFVKQHVYFDAQLNHRQGQLRSIFPTPKTQNVGIAVPAPGASAPPFMALMTNVIPDLGLAGISAVQYFARYTYRAVETDPSMLFPEDGTFGVFDEIDGKLTTSAAPGFERIDNITDETLTDYRGSFGKGVSKDDIFFYVYGLLHSREYRAQYEADLKKMLPRIPKARAFKQFVDAGRALSELHLNYETVEPYPLVENVAPNASVRVTKMRYAKEGRQDDKTTIIYNDEITLAGIPEEAQGYRLGSRSALDWIIERYQLKTDKASGIVNDPNAWGDEHGDPRYILDLIKRITTVSVETVRIVDGLPSLETIS